MVSRQQDWEVAFLPLKQPAPTRGLNSREVRGQGIFLNHLGTGPPSNPFPTDQPPSGCMAASSLLEFTSKNVLVVFLLESSGQECSRGFPVGIP